LEFAGADGFERPAARGAQVDEVFFGDVFGRPLPLRRGVHGFDHLDVPNILDGFIGDQAVKFAFAFDWPRLKTAVTSACRKCVWHDNASPQVCGECPVVNVLENLLKGN